MPTKIAQTTARITQATVRKLTTADAARDVHDASVRGLVVRVRPSGAKTWLVRLKDPNKRHPKTGRPVWYWWTLGSADVLTPEQARGLAKTAIGQAASGHDPRKASTEARARAKRSITLAHFLDEDYGPWVTENRKTGALTLARVRAVFADLLATTLSDLAPFAIERWRTARLKAGITPSTINRDLVALKAALSKAVEWNRLPVHPLVSVKRSRVDARGAVRFLSPDEETRLLAALDARDADRRAARKTANTWRQERAHPPLTEFTGYTHLLNPMVRVAMHTGLRFGELANLRWQDVTLDAHNATITVHGDGAKSGQTRHVPLHDVVRDVLKAWRPASADGADFVFPGKDGARLVDVKTAWGQLLKRASIEDFRFHDLSHHFASRLVQGGADLNVVRDLLGHRDFAMTLRYAHLAPDNRRLAVERLVSGSAG